MRLVVVDNGRDLPSPVEGVAITAEDFIAGNNLSHLPAIDHVTNLCTDVGYLSLGYHVSILAEARGYSVTPSVSALIDLRDGRSRIAVQRARTIKSSGYRIAMLRNPAEQMPPSNNEALANFVRIGRTLGVTVELITGVDYHRLDDFNALFIRETTDIDDTTYRFARTAEAMGMPVIDDSRSICRCANKVYLGERMQANGVPTPKTIVVNRSRLDDIGKEIGFPVVLKAPDGAFSRGVHKANDRVELETITERLFKATGLIIAQEFIRTAFDWRIGVVRHQPVYACQYFMADGHWQVVKYTGLGSNDYVEGDYRTLAIEEAPAKAVALAVKAASLIGDGLYGVDIKETPSGFVVVEVNDNPNIDAGIEDAVLGDELYALILRDFIRRIEQSAVTVATPATVAVNGGVAETG